MGLFGKLFDKKTCDLCGEEIGLLGNRKLEDGNCCKACAKKLSPWFNDRRKSTVEEIRQQLTYREENRKEAESFTETDSFGTGFHRLLIDRNTARFLVTEGNKSLKESNPDVLTFHQVTGVSFHIKEDRDEVTKREKNEDGEYERESYFPPRYRFYYNFELSIHVNHPYFDEMEFTLNDHRIEVTPHKEKGFFLFEAEGSPSAPSEEDKRNTPEFAQFLSDCETIRELFTNSAYKATATDSADRDQALALVQESDKPKAKFCRWCGAPVGHPNQDGTCEFCGGKLDD